MGTPDILSLIFGTAGPASLAQREHIVKPDGE
jgi:hypothetical protein